METTERKRKKPDAAVMHYQEPHAARIAQGKLLEEAIGRQVKQYREKLGLTIAELAKAADMPISGNGYLSGLCAF